MSQTRPYLTSCPTAPSRLDWCWCYKLDSWLSFLSLISQFLYYYFLFSDFTPFSYLSFCSWLNTNMRYRCTVEMRWVTRDWISFIYCVSDSVKTELDSAMQCTMHTPSYDCPFAFSTCFHHEKTTTKAWNFFFFEVVLLGWSSAVVLCQTWQFESHDFKSAGKINSEKRRGKESNGLFM